MRWQVISLVIYKDGKSTQDDYEWEDAVMNSVRRHDGWTKIIERPDLIVVLWNQEQERVLLEYRFCVPVKGWSLR